MSLSASVIVIIVAGIVLLSLLTWGTFWLLFELGIIVNEARKPAYNDTNDYLLNQGHDVGKEDPHN